MFTCLSNRGSLPFTAIEIVPGLLRLLRLLRLLDNDLRQLGADRYDSGSVGALFFLPLSMRFKLGQITRRPVGKIACQMVLGQSV